MCADYLTANAHQMSEAVGQAAGRDAFRGSDEEFLEAILSSAGKSIIALTLVSSANNNGIGMYYTLYGKDDTGVFYLHDSALEYVVGTSVKLSDRDDLKAAFDAQSDKSGELLRGRTLRDTTQYRLVPIPSTDRKSVVGVIEVGSKMRSFESSIAGDLIQRILALLVMVLVVYLAYSELRACGQCLFTYRERQ